MKTIAQVSVLVIAICSAAWAAQRPSILGYTSSSSFWVELPAGWRADAAAAKRTGALFILVPTGSTFDTAPAVIVSSVFHRTTITEAMARDRASFRTDDPQVKISSPRSFVARSGAPFTVREFRSQKLKQQGYEEVAYHQEGPDVVVLTISAQSERSLRDARSVFDPLLKTYDSAKIKVKPGP